jgi:DNA-binding LacI/PurR family transcriptional regulator
VTVTKALLGHPDIAKETIQIVRDKALEMGYIPDFIGRSLSSRRTMIIGMIVPKIAHSFFSYSIERMYEAARGRGYNIIPMVSFEDTEKEIENIRTLLSMRVDGIILDIAQNSNSTKSYELARQSGCKVVFFDRYPEGCIKDSIVTDDRQGAYNLTKHLIDKGYKYIYFFSGPPYLNISRDRRRGYEDAMQECQMHAKIVNVDLQKESGYNALLKMYQEGDSADAVFAVNDSVATGVYEAAARLGLRIPEDIAVAGFGDINTSSMLQPPMTSVRPPIDEMAKAAVESIIAMIENNLEGLEQKVFPSRLMLRQST